MNAPRRITLAFTGASGMPFGLRLLECLLGAGVPVDLVYSSAAQIVARQECDLTLPSQPREATRMLASAVRRDATASLTVYRATTGWRRWRRDRIRVTRWRSARARWARSAPSPTAWPTT